VLEENASITCDQHIYDMDSNVIPDENVVAPNLEYEKAKNELSENPHRRNYLCITILGQLPVLHSYWYSEDVRKRTVDQC